MSNSNHPDLKRLEQLLSENPTWAVKITDVDRANEPQRLFLKGKKTLWIHDHHLADGIQSHVIKLAKDRSIKTMGFEIKRKNGSGYIHPGKNMLSDPYFTIPFENQSNSVATDQVGNYAFAKAEPSKVSQPVIKDVMLSGLSGPQMMDLWGQSIEKRFVEKELSEMKMKLNLIEPENERLKKELQDLKNERFLESKPKAGDKILDALTENPAVIGDFFGMVTGMINKAKPSEGALRGESKTVEPVRSAQKTKLINHIDAHDDDKAAAMGDVALLMEKDTEFASELAAMVQEKFMKLMKTA